MYYPKNEDGSYVNKDKIHSDLQRWHCPPANYNLIWTLSGYWLRAPRINDCIINTQDQIKGWKACRIETFFEKDGSKKKALAYGDEDSSLVVWYDLQDIKNTFPQWTIPENSDIENKRRFSYVKVKTPVPERKNYVRPIARSNQRGNYRGRGNNRGRGYQQSQQYDGYSSSYDSGMGRVNRRYDEDPDYGGRNYDHEGSSAYQEGF